MIKFCPASLDQYIPVSGHFSAALLLSPSLTKATAPVLAFPDRGIEQLDSNIRPGCLGHDEVCHEQPLSVLKNHKTSLPGSRQWRQSGNAALQVHVFSISDIQPTYSDSAAKG